MSLLGKLFSGLPSSSLSPSRSTNPPDSYLEDQFTYNLLFPDAEALRHNDQVFHLSFGTVLPHATTDAFDTSAEMDLQMRDVRVIIMQEATPITGSGYLLYDSHAQLFPLDRQPVSAGSTLQSRAEGRRSSTPRKSSMGQGTRPLAQQEIPAQRSVGAFDRRAVHSKVHNETEGQRSAREYREEINMISTCIFGSSDVWANKRTETKVHPLPSDTMSSSSNIPESSLGRSSMRSSKLSQSMTSEDLGNGHISSGLSSLNTSRLERKKFLVTRMFPVPLPIEDTIDESTPTLRSAEENPNYPFPTMGEHSPGKKVPQPKQKRTPMYAIGLIVHLPAPRASAPASRSSFRGPGSHTDQDSGSSSYSSARRAGWTMLGNGLGVESLDSSLSSESEDHMDTITQHWDVIMRSLSRLQAVITTSLLPMLRQADIASPDPRRQAMHKRSPSAGMVDDTKVFKPPKTNAKLIQLAPNCLMPVQNIHKEVDAARQRIISGIKATRVITGQGRWAIWREEARIVNNWAGGKEKGFFFFNLLTGFLGNHTEWVQALGPTANQRKDSPQRPNQESDILLSARTIVVSNDKIAARRIIFLLSAFLPANQSFTSMRLHRPSTASLGGQSQSPPNGAVPILKEVPLRRQLDRRAGLVRTSQTQLNYITSNGPPEPQQRRPSDATSVKTVNLPISGNDIGTNKNNTATTSSTTQVTIKAHIFSRPVRGTGPAPRPESSGSLATDDLIRSLKRGEISSRSSTMSSNSQGQNSGWGSMISGFWSSKRKDSSATDVSPSSMDPFEFENFRYKSQERGKLTDMVDEVVEMNRQQADNATLSGTESTKTTKAEEQAKEDLVNASARVPDPLGAFQSPVRTTINPDGVIEIDVPLPDYLTSYETALSSPSSSGYFSTPGFGTSVDALENNRNNTCTDASLNVGGWLPHFHPDYALQAVPSQSDLVDNIKASMRTEPTPARIALNDHGKYQWVDITSTIIADTTNFTIKCLVYQRLLQVNDWSTPRTAYINPPSVGRTSDGRSEDRFLTETIITTDETLIEAIERVLVQSSKTSSASSSPSRGRDIHVATEAKATEETKQRGRSDSDAFIQAHKGATQEVHRNQCRKIIVSALEEIVKSVVEELSIEEEENFPLLPKQGSRRERTNILREGVRNWIVSGEQ